MLYIVCTVLCNIMYCIMYYIVYCIMIVLYYNYCIVLCIILCIVLCIVLYCYYVGTITPTQLRLSRDLRMINNAVARIVSKTHFFPAVIAHKLFHSCSVLETTSRTSLRLLFSLRTVISSVMILRNPKQITVIPC